jgi:hypothetical protein
MNSRHFAQNQESFSACSNFSVLVFRFIAQFRHFAQNQESFSVYYNFGFKNFRSAVFPFQ